MKISGLVVQAALPAAPDWGRDRPPSARRDGVRALPCPHQRCHFLAKVAMKAAHMKVPNIA